MNGRGGAFLSLNGAFLCILQSAAVILGQRMPDVQGQWDFYPNLRLKIKHTLSARAVNQ